jgi:hypothetical protein
MRLLGPLLVGAGLFAGCVEPPMGELLCKDPPGLCECTDDPARGGVVVRWRIADASVGQLLDRGQCCCNPDPTAHDLLKQQCANNDCLDAPAWLVRNVRLHIKSVSTNLPPVDCTITAPCVDGELTTKYCLAEGTYDLQLSADIDIVNAANNQFACSGRHTLSPPVVRRSVKPGQAVNLDGIVLGVNAPPVSQPSDGGTTD